MSEAKEEKKVVRIIIEHFYDEDREEDPDYDDGMHKKIYLGDTDLHDGHYIILGKRVLSYEIYHDTSGPFVYRRL